MAQEPTPGIGWLQAQFPSIGTLINNVAVEVGLNASAAPLSSTDPNFVQMVVLANKLGKQLMRRCEWQLLNRTYTFQTVNTGPPTPDVTFYALPNDFNRMINQTAWNRTSRLPMAGPLTAQGWEWLVGLVSATSTPSTWASGSGAGRLPSTRVPTRPRRPSPSSTSPTPGCSRRGRRRWTSGRKSSPRPGTFRSTTS